MPAFDSNSRYVDLENATLTIREDGESRRVVYKKRRFLPPLHELTLVAEQPLVDGSRLDLLAQEYSEDPQNFWQICDGNPILHPDELAEDPGRVIRITTSASLRMPQGAEG